MEYKHVDTEQQENITIHQDKFDEAITEFEYKNNIDLKEGTQQNWNAFLMFARRYLRGLINLTDKLNGYDMQAINDLLDVYIEKCMIYDKEVSIVGFSLLSGINQDTIYTWANDREKYRNGKNKLSSSGNEIYQKLHYFREESLSDKLQNKGVNQIGILAILNHSYQWNMPGVKEQRNDKALIKREDIAAIETDNATPALPIVGE